MQPLPKTIAIVAGEASGDMYAADLIRELHHHDPSLQFYGIGGSLMQEAGSEVLVDLAKAGVVGFVEVIRHFRIIRSAFRALQARMREQKPDLLILIDYPGFNLRMARYAKSLGIRVLYYISPQIWAWKAGRIKQIQSYVDHMAVILPFEKVIYEHAQVPVSFVGHPLIDRVKITLDEKTARQQWHCREDSILIGLVPGSRRHEIQRLLPVMLEAAAIIFSQFPEVEFLLPLASTLSEDDLQPYLSSAQSLPLTIIKNANYEVMKYSKALLIASGTATLEACLLQTPMVITYKTSRLSYEIIKRLIQVKHIGLCNLLAGRTIVPERIQNDASAIALAEDLMHYLKDSAYYASTQQALKEVAESLGASKKDLSLNDLVLQLLTKI